MKKTNSRKFSAAQLQMLDRLVRTDASMIDFSDAPEQRNWAGAKRGMFYKPVKQQLTVRLDAEVVDWFKSQGPGYQTLINAVLRREFNAGGRPQRGIPSKESDDTGRSHFTLEYYKDAQGKFRWRRVATNGEIVGASSESYSSKRQAEDNANRAMPSDKWEFYKDKAGQYRWRCFSPDNGRQVGKSTESFASPSGCKDNARINGYMGWLRRS